MSRLLAGLVTQFLADRKAAGYSERTLEGYRCTLAHLLSVLDEQGIDDVQGLTADALTAYQKQLLVDGGKTGRRLALSTQACHIAQVRTFCRFLVTREYALIDPARGLVPPRVVRRPPDRVLDHAAMSRLLMAPDTRTPRGARDRAMLELFYSTGLRVSELTALDVYDVDLVEGELAVQRGKGSKGRRVPVGAAACQWVGRYLGEVRPALVRRASELALFVSQRGRRLNRRDVAALVQAHAKAARIRMRVTPHTLRHTFASHMLRGRASLRHLQEILGHAQLTTTQIYTKVDITDLKEVHRRCHPRGRS